MRLRVRRSVRHDGSSADLFKNARELVIIHGAEEYRLRITRADGAGSGAREAGAIGGWPETRPAPAPLRPSPFIPLKPARPAPSVGGLRQGAPQLRSARRPSFHRGPRGRDTSWVA